MRFKTALLSFACTLLGMATTAGAVPITYLGTITSNTTVSGVNTQDPFLLDEPIGADYWRFVVPAGTTVVVDGNRGVGSYDMALWVFAGTFTDTTQFQGPFDQFTPGFVARFDDEAAPNFPGPFGDPQGSFLATAGGVYTLVVTNNVSDGDPPNPYTLTVRSVPEPGSMLLLAAGLAAAAGRWRSGRPTAATSHTTCAH